MQVCSETQVDKGKALLRLSSHFGDLAQQVSCIEDAVSKMHSEFHNIDQQAINSLQSLDFLRQSLEDMEQAIKFIACEDSDLGLAQCCLVCRASTLKLASSRSILLGEDLAAEPMFGDIDLF